MCERMREIVGVLEADIKVKERWWKNKVQRAVMSGFEDVKRKKKICVIWERTGMEKRIWEKKKDKWVTEMTSELQYGQVHGGGRWKELVIWLKKVKCGSDVIWERRGWLGLVGK